MAVKIQLRRDTAANWNSNNPILAEGEIGVELDTNRMKVGDGSTHWNDLPYTFENYYVKIGETVANADKLDNQDGSYYTNANNLSAGIVPVERLSGTYNIDITGNADKVDNFDASQSPQAKQIPVLNSSGQLCLPFIQTPILVNGQDMMHRTFYVDAENGDDNNNGSSSAPFKTIKKACDSIPNGGYGTIYLSAGQIFHISVSVGLNNKTIIMYGDASNNSKIIFDTYNDDNYNYSRSIGLSNSRLMIRYCILENAEKSDSNLPWAVNDWSPPILNNKNGYIQLYNCTINQTNKYFITTRTGFGAVHLATCDINFSGDAIALVDSGGGNCAFSLYNSTATTGYKWIDGGTIGQNVITHLSSLDT